MGAAETSQVKVGRAVGHTETTKCSKNQGHKEVSTSSLQNRMHPEPIDGGTVPRQVHRSDQEKRVCVVLEIGHYINGRVREETLTGRLQLPNRTSRSISYASSRILQAGWGSARAWPTLDS